MSLAIEQDTAAGNEAGTGPGDRRFRPDVQGLRAVAIALVVLYHADIPGIGGGYVGVDVFFVISGFVITGVLLRERQTQRRTSFLNFYGRRARRIIPAASLVIVVTAVAAYHYLGPLTGHETAIDGQWAALFLANFHFAASETNYLASQQPPSALQNFWSLAVEEQFYIVYPALFVLCASVARRFSLRMRLSVVLMTVIVASYVYSIVLTSSNAPSAFFSPLTRAWELALGALIAVSTDSLRRLPGALAALAGWLGLGAIVLAATTLTSASVYPGALVALPVLGAGLVIASGAAQPRWGAERLLRLGPLQFLGLISYSLYLWHWPFLVIATQHRGVNALPTADNVVLLLCAGVVATLTYWLIENPIRHARVLRTRRWASVVLGLCLIGATLVVTTVEQRRPTVDLGALGTATSGSNCPLPSSSQVGRLRSSYARSHPRAATASDGIEQSLVMVGDSTACTLLAGLQAVGPSYGMRIENGAVIGCGVVSGQIPPRIAAGIEINNSTSKCQRDANAAETEAIERARPNIIVWGSTEERNSILVHTQTGSKALETGTPAWRSVMLKRIDDRVEQFLATGAKVILLLEPGSVHGGQRNADDLAFAHLNDLLKEVAARHPHGVGVVDLAERVCPSGPPCQYFVDGQGSVSHVDQAVRPDGTHYLGPGALWVAQWLVPRIAAEAKSLH